MKIFIASDHAGIELKNQMIAKLLDAQYLPEVKREVIDLGPNSTASVDYPDYADLVCKKIHGISGSMPSEIGILICGSGQGMAMRANKYPHIRAALCWSAESAKLSREHNDANVLCLGARLLSEEVAFECLKAFLSQTFAGGRHAVRVAKVIARI
jgi:ribose 5-phosphate isomerase B